MDTKQIKKKAIVDNIPAVTEEIELMMQEADCPMKVMVQVNVAIDEIFSNIANYSSAGDEPVYVTICCDFSKENTISITFADDGIPYNPLDREDPDVTLSAEERAIGGLGIYIVKKSMDDVKYEYSDGKNHLTITKTW